MQNEIEQILQSLSSIKLVGDDLTWGCGGPLDVLPNLLSEESKVLRLQDLAMAPFQRLPAAVVKVQPPRKRHNGLQNP